VIISVRQALLRIARSKAEFALLMVALGLTMGAVVCALSFAHLVVSKPLPYPQQERLVVAEQVIFGQGNSANSRDFSYPALALVHEMASEVFAASVMMDSARDVVLSHPAQPLVSLNYVTGDYPQLFAPQMALGQFPGANAFADDAGPIAVISFAAWQSLFGMRSDVLGQRIRTATGDFEVVGVTAADFVEPEFNGPGHRTSVWLPWAFNPSPQHWGWAATTPTLTLAARLAPGLSNSKASERLSVLLGAKWHEEVFDSRFAEAKPLGTSAGAHAGWATRVELSDAQRAIVGDGRDVGLLMLAGTLGLVLVVLVNVTHLLIARVAQRAREFSIQLALGATRNQLFVLVLSDMLLLMLPAGVAAVVIAAAGFAIMQRYLFTLLPRIEQLSVGFWTVALTLSAVLALTFLLAEISLRSCGRIHANDALNSGRSATVSKLSSRLRVALMASQVAVAGLVIAVNLGLFRDAKQILNEPGIDLERSASAFLYQSASASQHKATFEQQLTEIKRQLRELPGVEAVSQSHSPLQDFIQTAVVHRARSFR
jgi:MacB-like periplasmic core domain